MDAPTYNDLFRVARDAMLARNRKLTRGIIEREGTDYNAITHAIASMGDEVVAHNTLICASNMLDSCRGEKLTRYVYDKYGIVRKPASVALGSARFSSLTPATTTYNIPAGIKLVSTDGKQFITTSSASVTVGSSGPVTVAVRSLLAGLDQQAQKDTIKSVLDPIPNAPASLQVTNPLATTGADDEESDDDLRTRARRYFETIRAGTVPAIEFKALSYPGVRRAKAFEVLDALGRPAKAVQLIIADAFTDVLVNTADNAYEAQSQILADAVYASLIDTRGAGIFVDVFLGQVVLQSVLLALNFTADADIEMTALQARAAIVLYVNGLAPGSPFQIAGALDALRSVPGLIVTGSEILSPLGNVVPATRQVLRTNMALVRATTLQPDRALQGSTNADSVT